MDRFESIESMMHYPLTWVLAVGFLVGLAVLIAGAVLLSWGPRSRRR